MLDVTVIEDPEAAARLAGPHTGPAARRAGGRARVGRHAGRQGRAAPAEGELPPQGAGAARPGRAGRGAPQGQRHRAADAGDRRVVRDLAARPGRRTARPGPFPGPALRPLAAGARRPAGPGRRLADHRRRQGPQAARDLRARRRGALRLGRRPGRVRRGADGGRRRADPQVRRARRRGRPRPPDRRRRPPDGQTQAAEPASRARPAA